MKKIIYALLVLLAVTSVHASEDCIIDPELMHKDVWAEPYFPSPEEYQRNLASESPQAVEIVKSPAQYLDVIKTIPQSEPTITRAWMEYKFLTAE